MKKFIVLLFLIQPLFIKGQWSSLNSGLSDNGTSLFYDSASNMLYVGGWFTYADNLQINKIATWDGVKWDSLGNGAPYGAPVSSIMKFQNKIYATGIFYAFQPGDPNCMAWWNGIYWDTLNMGPNTPIRNFRIINNELYVCGSFDKIGNQTANLLAKFDGINFTAISVPGPADGYFVSDVAYYMGNLYVGGNFLDTLSGANDLEFWNGNSFQPVGGTGLPFGVNWVSTLVVYNNELYIGGSFTTSAGAPSSHVMKWNGTQFLPVGTGFDALVRRLKVINGELYACGHFSLAGSIQVSGFAKWDGNNWVQVFPPFQNSGIFDFEIINSELYITGAFTTIDSIPVNNIAKYSGVIKVSEIKNNIQIKITPNPTRENLKVKSEKVNVSIYSVIDLCGRNIFSYYTNSKDFVIDLTAISSGIYFLQLETHEGRVVKKFVKE